MHLDKRCIRNIGAFGPTGAGPWCEDPLNADRCERGACCGGHRHSCGHSDERAHCKNEPLDPKHALQINRVESVLDIGDGVVCE